MWRTNAWRYLNNTSCTDKKVNPNKSSIFIFSVDLPTKEQLELIKQQKEDEMKEFEEHKENETKE